MKHLKLIVFALWIFYLSSCAAPQILTSDVKPNEVTELQKFETLSYISLIEKGNRGQYNDSVSNISKINFDNSLNTLRNKIPLTGQVSITDTVVKNKIEKEIKFLTFSAENTRSTSRLKLPLMLDSIMDIQGKRFGLITITSGFTRAKSNYGGQVAKGAALGILTLGMYYQTPIKANSTIYVIIIDAYKNNIAFFGKSVFTDKEPLDQEVVSKQIQKIFEGYFWTKKRH